jgi:DNA-binding transcriptional LysR family regulator
MELRHLRYFVAVAEELNYRKAAERLHVAPPALSRQVKDLESELGVQLLDRDTGGVRLTDAGAAFLAEARIMLTQSQRAVAVAQEAAKGLRGQLTVGYVGPILMRFMPASLMAFHQRFLGVEIVLDEMPLADQIAALVSGTIQIGFTMAGDARLPRGLRRIKIVCSPVRAVMEREYHLAGLSDVALADLAREPLLCLALRKGSPTLHGELIRRIFAFHQLKHRPIKRIEGSEAFRAALESRLGVSLIPEIGGLSRNPVLAFRPLKDTGADLNVCLYALWRDSPCSQTAANFIALMREIAPRGIGTGSGRRSLAGDCGQPAAKAGRTKLAAN